MKACKICLLMAIICIMCGCETTDKSVQNEAAPVTGSFDVTVLKSGQADAMLLKTENHSIVIDCGEEDDGDKVLECLAENNISEPDYIFITHFDKDHVGGFPEVAKNVNAKNIIVPAYEGNNDEYEKYLEAVAENNLEITALENDISFTLDDVFIEVSVPKKQSYAENDNDFSLVISATHGENTFLFAGDAEKGRLPEVLQDFGREYDFLKVPHHGKYNKNTQRFISVIKPSYAVICDSEKNPAEAKTMALLNSAGTTVYSTANGDVMVSSDGKEISITQ